MKKRMFFCRKLLTNKKEYVIIQSGDKGPTFRRQKGRTHIVMKFVLGGFHEEVNSFSPGRTTYDQYLKVFGQDEIDFAANHKREIISYDMVSAVYHVLTEAGATVIPGGYMHAQSGPIIEQSVLDGYIEKLTAVIKANMPVDGVVLLVHGAAQSEQCEDPEGAILEAVRRIVGDKAVITVGCDLHSCITEKMVKNANAICGYQQYPHVDFWETGTRAATLALRMLKGEIKPYMAYVKIPMLVPASGYTTRTEPFCRIMNEGKRLIADGTLYDFSVFQMQPWLDVSVGGSSAVVIADSKEKAAAVAKDFAAQLYSMRHAFKSELTDVDTIIDIAEKNTTDKFVVLNDFADSSNAGAIGDSAQVLAHILKKKSDVHALMYINDPGLALRCREVGVGNPIKDKVGGWCSTLYPPVAFEGTVKALFDGRMSMYKHSFNNFGPSAVIQIRNTILIVTTRHNSNGKVGLYQCFGYDPVNFDMVVVKACTSFRASYGPLTDLIYPADTVGPASSNLTAFPFEHVSKSFYPFTDSDDFVPEVNAWGKQNF